mmetsp:Transcript_26496/g.83996  ORF Transcript_26496/g.83996 Transcript_26496/m.83996 type:complete len:231 (-) Transcript_26496:630-1322(-)
MIYLHLHQAVLAVCIAEVAKDAEARHRLSTLRRTRPERLVSIAQGQWCRERTCRWADVAVAQADVLFHQGLLRDLLADVLGRHLGRRDHDNPGGALVQSVARCSGGRVEVPPDVADEVALIALPMRGRARCPARRLVHDHDPPLRPVHQHLRPGPGLRHGEAPAPLAEGLGAHKGLGVLGVHYWPHKRLPRLRAEAHGELPSAGVEEAILSLAAGGLLGLARGPLVLYQP